MWRTETAVPPRLPPLLQEFIDYRLRHRGIALVSAQRDVEIISALRLFLQQRQRSLQRMRLQDIDAFVVCQRKRFCTEDDFPCLLQRARLSSFPSREGGVCLPIWRRRLRRRSSACTRIRPDRCRGRTCAGFCGRSIERRGRGGATMPCCC